MLITIFLVLAKCLTACAIPTSTDIQNAIDTPLDPESSLIHEPVETILSSFARLFTPSCISPFLGPVEELKNDLVQLNITSPSEMESLANYFGIYTMFYESVICHQHNNISLFDHLKAIKLKGGCSKYSSPSLNESLEEIVLTSLIYNFCSSPLASMPVLAAYTIDFIEGASEEFQSSLKHMIQVLFEAPEVQPLRSFAVTDRLLRIYYGEYLRSRTVAIACQPRPHPMCPPVVCPVYSSSGQYRDYHLEDTTKMKAMILTVCKQLHEYKVNSMTDLSVPVSSFKDPFTNRFRIDPLCKFIGANPLDITAGSRIYGLMEVCSSQPSRPLTFSQSNPMDPSRQTQINLCQSMLHPRSENSMFVGTYAFLASMCLDHRV